MNSEAGMAESDTTERLNSTELNFNNFVSQGIGRPNKRERERWGNCQSVEWSKHMQNLLIKFTILNGHSA